MSLFEKLNNKRYDLQEKERKKSFPSGSFDPANQEKKFVENEKNKNIESGSCLLYTSPSPRDRYGSRMPSSA